MNTLPLPTLHRTEIKALAPQLALPSMFGRPALDIKRSNSHATFMTYPVERDIYVRIGRDDTPGRKSRISFERFKQTDPEFPEYTHKRCWVSMPPDRSSMGLNHIVVGGNSLRHMRCDFDCLGIASRILLATYDRSSNDSTYRYKIEFYLTRETATLTRGKSAFTDPITAEWILIAGMNSLTVYSKENIYDTNHMDLIMLRSLLGLPHTVSHIEFHYPFLLPGFIEQMDLSTLLDIAAEFYVQGKAGSKPTPRLKRLSIQDRDFSSIREHRPRPEESEKPWLTSPSHIVRVELEQLSSLAALFPPPLHRLEPFPDEKET